MSSESASLTSSECSVVQPSVHRWASLNVLYLVVACVMQYWIEFSVIQQNYGKPQGVFDIYLGGCAVPLIIRTRDFLRSRLWSQLAILVSDATAIFCEYR